MHMHWNEPFTACQKTLLSNVLEGKNTRLSLSSLFVLAVTKLICMFALMEGLFLFVGLLSVPLRHTTFPYGAIIHLVLLSLIAAVASDDEYSHQPI